MAKQSIPTVDMSPFLRGTDADRHQVARAVGDACETIGFFTVVGHAVPQSCINALYREARGFFDLSLEEKLVLQTSSGAGYIPLRSENLAATLGDVAPADLKESFNIKSQQDQNVWPASGSALRPTSLAYFVQMARLAGQLMRIFALALQLPETFFDDKISPPNAVLRLANYPELDSLPLPGQLRAATHTDYGTLTIVWPDAAPGGLQVLTRTGEWIDVVTPPTAFVVNIGDIMQHWTNNRWVSTLHRVANPPELANSRRQSLVFFHNPHDDVLITCLDTCTSVDHPAQYPPILAGEHRRSKSQRSRQLLAHTA